MTDPARAAAMKAAELAYDLPSLPGETAADEIAQMADAIEPIIRAAIEAEREACAEIADDQAKLDWAKYEGYDDEAIRDCAITAERIARRIRQRSDSGEAPSGSRRSGGAVPPAKCETCSGHGTVFYGEDEGICPDCEGA